MPAVRRRREIPRRSRLAARLGTAQVGTAFVPDADGTGTVLYAAVPGTRFEPQFGPSSRDRHLATGAAEIGTGEIGTGEIGTELAGLRRDVDTIEDLRAAAKIGLGAHTHGAGGGGRSWVRNYCGPIAPQ